MNPKRCHRCGALLQTQSEIDVGFVDEKVYHRDETIQCKRCFDITHYNRSFDYLTDMTYETILNQIKTFPGLVCLVTDILTIQSGLLNIFSYPGFKSNVFLIVHKVDLLLHHIQIQSFSDAIIRLCDHLQWPISNIFLTSIEHKHSIQTLIEAIEETKYQRIYFIGATNVGKSSLINGISEVLHIDRIKLTTSYMPHTTRDFIEVAISKKQSIYDTPALQLSTPLIRNLEYHHRKHLIVSGYIRPKTFQIKSHQTLFIQGFIRVDILCSTKASVTTYVSTSLLVHRTKYEHADAFYETHRDDILLIPNSDERQRLGPLVKHIHHLQLGEKVDIEMEGLGFISVLGEMTLHIHSFENHRVFIRKAII